MWLIDRLVNLVSGMGTAKDKATGGAFVHVAVDRHQIEAMYRGSWLGRKVIDIPASDMTRGWRNWQGEEGQIAGLEARERALSLKGRLRSGLRMSRLYGGAALILGFGDNSPDKPPGKGAELKYVHALPPHMIEHGDIVSDPLSPFFGSAEHFTLRGEAGVSSVQVHPSRVVVLRNGSVAAGSGRLWGDSIFDIIAEPIMNAATASGAMATLLHEAKIDVIKVANLESHLQTPGGTERLKERFALASTLKSLNNMLLLGQSEEYQQKSVSFAGLPEVHARLLQEVAGAADIPMTRLLGQAPTGMNSTGESDLRNYYDGIAARQEDELRPVFDVIDPYMMPGTKTWYTFPSLWQMTELQKADIGKANADMLARLSDTGLFPADALAEAGANLLVENAIMPGLTEAIANARQAPGYEPEPDIGTEDDPVQSRGA